MALLLPLAPPGHGRTGFVLLALLAVTLLLGAPEPVRKVTAMLRDPQRRPVRYLDDPDPYTVWDGGTPTITTAVPEDEAEAEIAHARRWYTWIHGPARAAAGAAAVLALVAVGTLPYDTATGIAGRVAIAAAAGWTVYQLLRLPGRALQRRRPGATGHTCA